MKGLGCMENYMARENLLGPMVECTKDNLDKIKNMALENCKFRETQFLRANGNLTNLMAMVKSVLQMGTFTKVRNYGITYIILIYPPSLCKGSVKDGKPHGQGMMKQGRLMDSGASWYIGEWNQGLKSGYGVYNDILAGER